MPEATQQSLRDCVAVKKMRIQTARPSPESNPEWEGLQEKQKTEAESLHTLPVALAGCSRIIFD